VENADMADERIPDRKRTGTYLFVRPKSARKARGGGSLDAGRGTPAPAAPESPSASEGSEGRTARLRYRRPKLDARTVDPRLVFFLTPDAPVSENYRQIAAQLSDARPGTRRIWVAGAAPQAGATLTTANLGSALSEFGRVTLIDAATPRSGRALTSLFGLTGTEQGTGWDHLDLWLLADRLALQPESDLLPLTAESARNFQSISAAADFVLVDGPAVDEPESVGAMRQLVDAVVLVIRPADLGTGRYERALDRLQGMKVAGVMVNGATDDVLSA
jgi:Mrp family chromosome partitioning ATPase